jgi:uncharacterized protein YbbK (DUF523 family)
VRYNGGDAAVRHPVLARWLEERRVIPFCPEVAGGLPVPRPPAEISGGSGLDVLNGRARVLRRPGDDLTSFFLRGARLALEAAIEAGAPLAVLKDGSPSCATSRIYDGSFRGVAVPGSGVTATLLREHGIAVFSEMQIEEADSYLRKFLTG